MELAITNLKGAKAGTVAASDVLWAAKPRRDLVFQVATSQMSNRRKVLAHTKTRSEVRGGGKKPWAQKGTGRARHGSIRSPIWVGGGVAHGPTKEVNFKKTVTKSQGRAALASVLSARLAEGRLVIAESLAVNTGKTKDASQVLTSLAKGLKDYKAGNRMLVVLPGTADDKATVRAIANIPWASAVRAQDLNALEVLSYPFLMASADAVAVVEKTFAKKKTSSTDSR